MPLNENAPSSASPSNGLSGVQVCSVIVVLGSLLVLAFLVLGPRSRPAPTAASAPSRVGARVSHLRFKAAEIDQMITISDLRGKIVLVNFWGPWCSYCRLEMPHLQKLVERYRNHPDFAFLSVTCAEDLQAENLQQLVNESKAYLDEEGFAFPLYVDPQGETRRKIVNVLGSGDGSIPYPLTFLVDRDGNVFRSWGGYTPGGEYEVAAALEEALTGR